MTLLEIVKESARVHKLQEPVVWSMIWQESRGNTFACRYEPKFYLRYLRNKQKPDLSGYVPNVLPTLATEKMHRATSWGLMQIMGETARWFGKIKNNYLYLPLIDPTVNVNIGCSYLRMQIDRAGGDLRKGLERYNGGSEYPDIILSHVRTKSYLPLLEDC